VEGCLMDLICSSCNKKITNEQGSAVFMCPNCGKEQIVRCAHCRTIVAKYKCSQCGFEGPN